MKPLSIFLLALLSLSFALPAARAEEGGDSSTVTVSRKEYEELLRRLRRMEDELKRLRRVERELDSLRRKLEESEGKTAEDEQPVVVVEEPRRFLGLFGEKSETVPSLDLSGFITVAYRYSNAEEHGRFTFDGIEVETRFNVFEELQVGADIEFREALPDEDDFYVEQAFIAWAPWMDRQVEITMGRFNSIVGIEAVDPPDKLLVSDSLFTEHLVPGDLTGAMVAWRLNTLRLFLACTNSAGFDDEGRRISNDNNYDKTWTVRLELRPGEREAFGLNLMAGPEHDDNNHDYRYTADVDYQCFCDEVYYAGFELQFGVEENAAGHNPSWWGVMGVFNYTFSKRMDFSVRAEYVDDSDGGARFGLLPSGKGPKLWSTAFALRFHPLTNMNIVLEYRLDSGDDEYFDAGHAERMFSAQVSVRF